MRNRLINRTWPIWVRLCCAPVAIAGGILSLPVSLLLMASGEHEKSDKLMDFWMV